MGGQGTWLEDLTGIITNTTPKAPPGSSTEPSVNKAKDQAKSTPYKPKQRSTILTGAPARQGDLRQPDTNAKAQLGN